MSYSYQPLQSVSVEDPVTKVEDMLRYACLRSGTKISWKTFPSNNISNSSIVWSCPPPSSNIITDRLVTAQIPIRLTITGNIVTTDGSFTPTCTLLNSGFDAPRAFPLSSAIDTLQVSINNDSLSVNMSDIVHPITRYNIGTDLRAREYSQTPNMADQSSVYADLVGTNRNPLGNYGNGFQDDIGPRGEFPFTIVSNPTGAASTGGTQLTAVVDFVVCEPLFLSPFYWGCSKDDNRGFFNVNSMDYTINFLTAAAQRMWSHAQTAAIASSGSIKVYSQITSMAASFNQFSPAFSYTPNTPMLLFKYYTPNLLKPLRQDIPYTYSYSEVQRYPTNIGTIAYSSDATQGSVTASNNIQLNQIPRRMYLVARPSNSVLQSAAGSQYTDTYLAIQNVSIQWANNNTVMSTANQYQLFQMNTKNHSEQSWEEWSGLGVYNSAFPGTSGSAKYCGGCGPLCIEFGTDIELNPDEAPGLSGQYQLLVNATIANKVVDGSWDNLDMTFWIIVVNEGTFTITSSASAQHQLAPLSKMDILDARQQVGLNYRAVQSYNGGDFLSALGNFASKVHDFLKDNKIISTVASAIPHPIAQAVATGARSFGYGYDGGCDGGIALGGGRRMTKAQMRAALRG